MTPLIMRSHCVASALAVVCSLLTTVLSTADEDLSPERRVIGGHSSLNHSAPWIVSLGSRPLSHACGAALLRPSWVITAAHCTVGLAKADSSPLHMYAGMDRLDRRNESQVQHRVAHGSDVRNHPQWSGGVGPFDIALIHVAEPFQPDGHSVVEIGLPAAGAPATGMADLYGWGSIDATNKNVAPKELQTVQLPLISTDECQKTYGKLKISHETNICAGVRGMPESGCRGDSGGPLSQDGRTLIGLVSWGMYPCNRWPTVFTGVALMLDWINGHIDGVDEVKAMNLIWEEEPEE